ncbi:MAG: hypothetical protein LBE13_04410 [Bacteroidales bacterium]|jgi:hypothetical protein|nr:hypothetical protein [Bacteroidales bacterium]
MKLENKNKIKTISLNDLVMLCKSFEKFYERYDCIAVDWDEVRIFMNNKRYRYLKTVYFTKQKIACTRYTKDEPFDNLIESDYNRIPFKTMSDWRNHLLMEIAECLVFNKKDE